MAKVSVVMPVYNSEKYLKESIESILNQSYSDFEFIIINDGSTDNSFKIIKEYAKLDKRINVISRENKGIVYSLNEAIQLAKGEYIARMDADDISAPKRIEKQLSFLKSHRDIDILGTQVKVVGNISNDIKEKNEKKLNIEFDIYDDNREKILNYWYCLAHPSVMFRKDILRELKGYNDFKSEDLDLWLRAIESGFKIYKLKEELIYFRMHEESKTRVDNQNYEGLKDGIKIKLIDVFKREFKKDFKYIVWGASNGGKITKEVLDEFFEKSQCIAFVDKFKTGEFEKIKILHPKDINHIKFDYVFIATEPGKEEAMSSLKSMGLKCIKDFLSTV
ncbi:glycosyl transferase [Clostridium acetobutylicum]|nr:glycosyl transferase [Clostridium acetobutylicum]